MKAIKGNNDVPQRRIIIENEHLVTLFDLLAYGICLERDTIPIPIDFGEEEMQGISHVIEDLCLAVIDRISLDPVNTLVESFKTNLTTVQEKVVADVVQRYITENSDDVRGVVIEALRLTVIDAVKQLVDELSNEAELFNLKKIVIKTRKHALVFC